MDGKVLRDLVLHRFLLERSYRPRPLLANPDWNYDDLLPLVVAHHRASRPDFTFVQIGAFDGLSNDCLHGIITGSPHVRGIVVEPQAGAFRRLQRTYAAYPHVHLVNAAISSSDGPRQFFTVADADIQQASLDLDHVRRHRIPEDRIVATTVRCYTLSTLLREHGLPHVDLLQIDAEGHDHEIIDTIDFAAHAPSIIRFEHVHMPRRACERCLAMLASRGYRFLSERRDTIAVRQARGAGTAAARTA